jgi:hypothetical protein
MPPGPAYNFLCVLSSAADILAHAARIRAAQAAVSGATTTSAKQKRRKIDPEEIPNDEAAPPSSLMNLSTRETATWRDVGPPSMNFSGILSVDIHSDLRPRTPQLPAASSRTYEPASLQSIPEYVPQEDPVEYTISPEASLSETKFIASQDVSCRLHVQSCLLYLVVGVWGNIYISQFSVISARPKPIHVIPLCNACSYNMTALTLRATHSHP